MIRSIRFAASMILACAALALSGCGGGIPFPSLGSAPVEAADQTKIDEQTALAFTNTYIAVSKAAQLAIRVGAPSGTMSPATVRRIGELDSQFYAAAVAVERAYRGGNASNYAAALIEFNRARDALADAF